MIKKLFEWTLLFSAIFYITQIFAQNKVNYYKGVEGKVLYSTYCSSCHGDDGRGVEGYIPPLAKSDFLHNYPDSSIYIIKYGRSTPMIVNGKIYTSVMEPFTFLTDDQVASLMNYLGTRWGNKAFNSYTGFAVGNILKINMRK